MTLIFTIFFAALGVCIGSFLNVVIYRTPRRQKFWRVQQRSKCPKCRHVLHGLDLVPIFSYLFLRGRCRYCRKPISPQYIIVELLTGACFAVAYMFYGLTWPLLTGLVGVCFLMALGWIDGQKQVVPDEVSLPGIAIVFILQVAAAVSAHASLLTTLRTLGILVLAAVIGGAWFGLQWLVSKGKWVGTGDIRYGALLGILLGLPNLLVAIFVAYIVGSVWAVILLLRRKVKLGSRIAFGTFLSAGGILTYLFGPSVVSWYQHLFGW